MGIEQWVFEERIEFFGTDEVDGESAREFKDRIRRCYELSGRAVAGGGAPEGSVLVHGTIQGFGNPAIGHGWVELPTGEVWEPISATVFPAWYFRAFYSAVEEVRYQRHEASIKMLFSGHYGRWHDEDEI